MNEKAIAFVAAEWQAIAGLPFMQRCLYLVLRWYMDRLSGRVGDKRGISLQGLAEELYVEPVRGRHAAECGSPSKKAIRSALDGLEKAGLIQPCGNGEVLVFFLPLARRTSGRSKDEGHMRGTQEGHDEGRTENKQAGRASAEKAPVYKLHEGHDDGHTQNPDEGHTSRTRVNHPSTEAMATAPTHDLSTGAVLVLPLLPEKVAAWIRLHEQRRGCRARVVASASQIGGWIDDGVTPAQLAEAYDLAVGDRVMTQNRAAINVPFLDIFVRRVLDSRPVSRKSEGPARGAWFASPVGIKAMAAKTGVEEREGESIEALRGRVEWALALAEDAERAARKEAIRARYEAGESVPSAARRMAEAALGETFVRRGKAQRPDVADRAAGDDSFDDDNGTVLL